MRNSDVRACRSAQAADTTSYKPASLLIAARRVATAGLSEFDAGVFGVLSMFVAIF